MQPSKLPLFAITAWLSEFLFLIGTCCIKVSILLFFRRMVKDLFEQRWRIAIWVGVCFTVTHTLIFAIILASSFDCIKYLTGGTRPGMSDAQVDFCLHTPRSVFAAGILSVISDSYAILLPWAITVPDQAKIRHERHLSFQYNRHHHRCLLSHKHFGQVPQDARSLLVC
jgi:hypothetical protein